MNILIINGHPDTDRYCSSVAEAYSKGARKSRAKVRRLDLATMSFDPILHKGYDEIQPLEPDLEKAQEDIKWAEHIVIIFPVWWATVPAILKGFIDRTILPGWAYKFTGIMSWEKYLKGRTARIIATAGAPGWYYRFVVGMPGVKMLKDTLKFVGIKPARATILGSLNIKVPPKRYLQKIERLGRRFA